MMNYGYAPQHRQEVPVFEVPGVMVTSARFVVQNQTYPMGSISSVSSFMLPADRSGEGLTFLLAFGALGFFGFTVLAGVAGAGVAAVMCAIVFACLVAGAVRVQRGIARRRPFYGVVISTAGMQVRAIVHQDQAFVQGVINALNHALSMR